MKKHLKLVSLLSLFVIATATFFIFAKRPVDDKPETIMIKSAQFHMGTSSLWVIYGNGKVEETELDGFNDAKKIQASYVKILETVQSFNAEGYKVTSFAENGLSSQTWILTRK